MEKRVRKTYYVVFAVLAVFMVMQFVFCHDTVVGSGENVGFSTINDLKVEKISADTVSGYRSIAMVKVEGITEEYSHLIFKSIHQSVAVFRGERCIYSMNASAKNSFTKTTGCVWNDVLLSEDMNGEELMIELTPAYKGISYKFPEIFLGEKTSIIFYIFQRGLPAVTMSFILICMGGGLIGFVFYNRNNLEVDKNLALLGFFGALVGIWKASDSSLAKLIFHGLPIFSLLPFMALLLVIIPVVIYMSELHSTKDDKKWLIPCFVSIGLNYVALFLQYFNLLDFRQIFGLILASIVFAIITTCFMVFQEQRKVGWNVKLKRNLIGMAIIVLGFVGDAGTYYLSGGVKTSVFVILSFMLYIVAQGYFVFKESGALIEDGEKAESFENLAFHDKLTGLFNRSAFVADTDPYTVVPDNYAVAVLDLNDLKKCNDSFGHEMGDKYIKDSAQIIQKTFGSIGNCYRMGGDEFYCLVPKGGRKACREQREKMDQLIEEYNASSNNIKISIACGYARYDNRMDYDLNATAKRADKLMYQNKEEMKGHRAPQS